MAEYAGYSGYDADAVKRKRAIADALMQRTLQQRGQPIEAWTQGAAKLADAYFARQAVNEADEASQGFTDSRKAMADKMLADAFPGAAGPTEEGAAFDLTPKAMEGRATENALGGQVRGMAELTGDPMAALEFGRGEQDRAMKLQDRELANEVLRKKMGAPIEVSKGASLYDPSTGAALYTAPDAAAAAERKLHSVLPDASGIPHQMFSNGDDVPLDWKVQDTFKSLDVGGVPYLYSGRGAAPPAPVATAADVGQSAGTVEAGKALGKSQAEAITNLPDIKATATRAIASIDELLNSKGFDAAYGLGRLNPLNMIPGSDAKNAEAIRSKLDGQFFISAITSLQQSLAPVSDADAMRLVASISQLSNPDISPAEARRVAGELKNFFQASIAKATSATTRGPIGNDGVKQLAQISSDEEFARLPSGAFFIGPDGKKRQKP